MSDESLLKESKSSLLRIQNFDAKSLSREEDLGRQLSFTAAVVPASRLIDLYKRIPVDVLGDLTDALLNTIRNQADGDFNRFKAVLDFSAEEANAAAKRQQLLTQVSGAYDATFNVVWQFIAFGVARVTDVSLLETQARGAIQGIDDKAVEFKKQLKDTQEEAQRILQDIKRVALEQGVSQQAEFFKGRADGHDLDAKSWRNYTLIASGVVLVFAILSLFLHKWEWLRPQSYSELVQLVTSKLIIFAILGYWVVLSAKNYTAHLHNAVINRHRQTALQTYRILADAAEGDASEDIVLAHAAACIFGSQETGFGRVGSVEGGSRSVLELLTKASSSSAQS